MSYNVQDQVTALFFREHNEQFKDEAVTLFGRVREGLEAGAIRVAEKIGSVWIVHQWIKQAILLGFRYGALEEVHGNGWNYYDKNTMPIRKLKLSDNIRMVPGGSMIRSGSYVASGTIIMPPAYINVGAYVASGCMIDSHALIGSCAQLGKNVHLSAASQIGGVLEPIGAMPVIIEDNVFIGGNSGVYEGVIVQENAVLGSGVILNGSIPVFDNVAGKFIKKTEAMPLIIPKNAVVIAGSRPMQSGPGQEQGLHVYCPVIIKYRDDKTEQSIKMEDILR